MSQPGAEPRSYRSGTAGPHDLEMLAAKWIGHFDALAAAREPNCSIYWECASELLRLIG